MTYCEKCEKETMSSENKFKDIVTDDNDEYLTVYVYCGTHKTDESYVE